MVKPKLLISSCLLGQNVKYDGTNNCLDKDILKKIKKNFQLFSFCPEISGGLETPRVPCEIASQNPLKIIDKTGNDKTENFRNGANLTLELCKNENITLSLLKSNSPSCSNKYIYDGTFTSTKINGLGVTAKIIKNNKIKVYNEFQIKELFINY